MPIRDCLSKGLTLAAIEVRCAKGVPKVLGWFRPEMFISVLHLRLSGGLWPSRSRFPRKARGQVKMRCTCKPK